MQKTKLLIIDDDVALCKNLIDILELEGYLVDASHNADDGTKKVESGFYNIILLDMKLPDSDGIAVLEKIKEISPDTEVIIFTAFAEMNTVIKAMDRNAFSFLPKPCDVPYLITTIKRALEKQSVVFENHILYQQTVKEEKNWVETFDSITDMISILDENLCVIKYNKALLQGLGVERKDILGKECHQIYVGIEEPSDSCICVKCKETQKSVSEEVDNLLIDGNFLMTCYPRFDETGKFNGIVHVTKDITERKKTEVQINKQRVILNAINRVFKEALTSKTERDVAETCLTVAEEITGSKFGFYGEINYKGLFDTIALSDPGWDACRIPETNALKMLNDMKIHGIYGTVLKEGKSTIFNDPGSHPDRIGIPEGHPPLNNFLGVPLKLAGKTIGMIGLANKESGYTLDDQQAIESLSAAFIEVLMKKRSEDALKGSEERFRSTFQQAAVGIAHVALDGQFLIINKRFCDITGYTEKEILKLTFKDITHPDDIEADTTFVDQMLNREISTYTMEKRYIKKDDTIVWANLTVSLVYDNSGEPEYFISVIEDIAKRKEAESALQQQIQQLTVLNSLSQQISTHLSLDQLVQAALDAITVAVNPDLALFFLRDGDKLNLQGMAPTNSKYCHDETPVHRVGECLCGLSVTEGKPMYSSDILNDPRCTWEECKKAGLRSFAALPMFSRDEIIGVLGVAFGTQHEFEKQSEFLQILSNGISTGLQNALLHIQEQRSAEELEAKVVERTTELTDANASLEEKNKELEHFNELFVNRELRINELKEMVKELKEKRGEKDE